VRLFNFLFGLHLSLIRRVVVLVVVVAAWLRYETVQVSNIFFYTASSAQRKKKKIEKNPKLVLDARRKVQKAIKF